jgi:nicotinate-nucleotide pyrophosphorylase (carboxylating)
LLKKTIEKKLLSFLDEDIQFGDITSDNIFDDRHISTAKLLLKEEEAILCGIDFFIQCFEICAKKFEYEKFYNDGSKIQKSDKILRIKAETKTILKCERTALNILQRLSGIASVSYKYNNLLKDTKIKILDTRKTLPGFRYFDKYAVRTGGCCNHRTGLYDMVMIKDNHIKAAGSIKNAVQKIKDTVSPYIKIEVETSVLDDVYSALETSVDVIMLDNMDNDTISKSVDIIRKQKPNILIEVSGNITENRILDLKKFDIDFISIGSLTHSVKAIDFSLLL